MQRKHSKEVGSVDDECTGQASTVKQFRLANVGASKIT